MGCYSGISYFEMSYSYLNSTLELCFQKCLNSYFNYAALQGPNCYCGNAFNMNMLVDYFKCNTPCYGNLNEICGSLSGYYSIYDLAPGKL